MPHFLHFSISSLSGGKYPREFIFFDFFRILVGQNSMQMPHPLQYRSSINKFGIISFPKRMDADKGRFQDRQKNKKQDDSVLRILYFICVHLRKSASNFIFEIYR